MSDVLLQMTERSEVSVHDIEALTQALDVPCSPEAASCILLNAHAACKLGQSGHLTKRDLAKHDTDRNETILNVKVSLSLPSASAKPAPLASVISWGHLPSIVFCENARDLH